MAEVFVDDADSRAGWFVETDEAIRFSEYVSQVPGVHYNRVEDIPKSPFEPLVEEEYSESPIRIIPLEREPC